MSRRRAAAAPALAAPSPKGWLLRVACNEQMRDDFVTLHEALEEILKVAAQLPRDRAAATRAQLAGLVTSCPPPRHPHPHHPCA